MEKLFDDFLRKKITYDQLLNFLKKLLKYECFYDIRILFSNLLEVQGDKDLALVIFNNYLKKNKFRSVVGQKILKQISYIKYGYVDTKGNKHVNENNMNMIDYKLQSPIEVAKSRIGICWDQVELERYLLLKNGITSESYFICYYDGDNCPTHTFITYQENGKYYWFEHAWEKYGEIREYDNLKNLLLDVQNKFITTEVRNFADKNNLIVYKYDKPKYGIGLSDFYKHCENGLKIDVNNL